MFQISWNVLIFLRIFPNRPVVYLVDENVVYENYWFFIVFFSSLPVFYLFLPRRSKSGLWKKRGKLVLLNAMKNFYEKCYVKIDENWRKKHTSTNNLSKKKWFYWLKVDLMKIIQNRAWISKKYASIWKKNVIHDHVLNGLLKSNFLLLEQHTFTLHTYLKFKKKTAKKKPSQVFLHK